MGRNKLSLALIAIAIIYTISPIDLMVGPFDDIVVDIVIFFINSYMKKATDKVKDVIKVDGIIKSEHVDLVGSAITSRAVEKIRSRPQESSGNKSLPTKSSNDSLARNTDSKSMSVFK